MDSVLYHSEHWETLKEYTRTYWPFEDAPVTEPVIKPGTLSSGQDRENGEVQELAENLREARVPRCDGAQIEEASKYIDPLSEATFEALRASLKANSGYFKVNEIPISQLLRSSGTFDMLLHLQKAVDFVLSQWENLSMLAQQRANEDPNEATWRLTLNCLLAFFFEYNLTQCKPTKDYIEMGPDAQFFDGCVQ